MADKIDRIILACLILLAVLGAASFAIAPAYAKGVDAGMGALENALSAALGAKFGLSIPKAGE